ncbi:MAG: dihydroorotate dehydrogenase [Euryarchaeota archaeon]|nr:dihydroorotate dehydrogenase [Euryarchaeota archaeon]
MVNVTGIDLKNPTILAAGIMGTTGAAMVRMAKAGAGAVVTKSIGPEPKTGHSNPSMVQLDCGYINAMGLPNPSYSDFVDEIRIAKEGADVPVIASIFGGDAPEFVQVAEGLEPAGPDAFELNVSCPHAEGYGATIGSDPALVEDITRAVRDAVDVPVWVKLTPNVTDIVSIGMAARRGGADAVVAINTVRAMAIDVASGYPILGNRFGGLSGAAIRPIAVKCIYDLYQALDIPIIGVGGVSSWQDGVELVMAGASAVQIGSAIVDSPDVFRHVAHGIERYLDENDHSGIEDIIGIAHEMI